MFFLLSGSELLRCQALAAVTLKRQNDCQFAESVRHLVEPATLAGIEIRGLEIDGNAEFGVEG